MIQFSQKFSNSLNFRKISPASPLRGWLGTTTKCLYGIPNSKRKQKSKWLDPKTQSNSIQKFKHIPFCQAILIYYLKSKPIFLSLFHTYISFITIISNHNILKTFYRLPYKMSIFIHSNINLEYICNINFQLRIHHSLLKLT